MDEYIMGYMDAVTEFEKDAITIGKGMSGLKGGLISRSGGSLFGGVRRTIGSDTKLTPQLWKGLKSDVASTQGIRLNEKGLFPKII